jgi:hypothetical protein
LTSRHRAATTGGSHVPRDVAKALGVSPDGKQVIFAIDEDKPIFIDVASGTVTTGPTEWSVFSSWQRLAP